MPYTYELTEGAVREFEEAFNWYKNKSTVAQDKLVIELAETIRVICKNPYQNRNPYKDYRERVLRKFPYKLIYVVVEEDRNVVIVSMFHHKRNPAKKYPGK